MLATCLLVVRSTADALPQCWDHISWASLSGLPGGRSLEWASVFLWAVPPYRTPVLRGTAQLWLSWSKSSEGPAPLQGLAAGLWGPPPPHVYPQR